jgi:hypothetical protein
MPWRDGEPGASSDILELNCSQRVSESGQQEALSGILEFNCSKRASD